MFLTADERALLAQVQPGDEIVRRRGVHWDMATVTRVTKTQIIINDTRYRKRDGGEVGYGGHISSVMSPTERFLTKVADWGHQVHRNRLINRIHTADLRDLPLEVLEQVAALVAGEMECQS